MRVLRVSVFVVLALCVSAYVSSAEEVMKFGGMDLAQFYVRSGVEEYYRINGHWPATWSRVEESGIVQVPLQTVYGKPVHPDDGSLDHAFDIQYVLSNNGANASLARRIETESLNTTVIEAIEPPHTYAEMFADARGEQYEQALGDSRRLAQISISVLCNRAMMFYESIYGGLPTTWEQMAASGLFPVDAASVSPLTGMPITGIGAANDFLFQFRSDGPSAQLMAVDAEGLPRWGHWH